MDGDMDQGKSKEAAAELHIVDIGANTEHISTSQDQPKIEDASENTEKPGGSAAMSDEKSDEPAKEEKQEGEAANPFEEDEEPAELEPMLDGSKQAVKKDKEKAKRDTPMKILMNMGNTLKETPLLKKKRQAPSDEAPTEPAGVMESVKTILNHPKDWAYDQGLLVMLLITLKLLLILLDYFLGWAFYDYSNMYHLPMDSVGYHARYVYLFFLIMTAPLILWELVCIFFEHRFCAGATKADDPQMFWFLFANACALHALCEFPMAIIIAVIVQYSCNCSLLAHLLALPAVQAKMWFSFFVFIKRAVCFEKTLCAQKLPTLKWIVICFFVIVPTFVVKLMLIIFAHIPAQNRQPAYLNEVRVSLTYGANYTIFVQAPTFCNFFAGAEDQVNYCHKISNSSVFHGKFKNASWGGYGFEHETSEVSVPCDQLFLKEYENWMFAKPGLLTDCNVVLDMEYDPSTHTVEYTALLKSSVVHHQDTSHKFWIDHITRPIPVPWTNMGMEYVTEQLQICNACRKSGARTCPSILPEDELKDTPDKNVTFKTPLLVCSTWCKAGCPMCTLHNDPVKNESVYKSLDACTCNTNNCSLTTSCEFIQDKRDNCNRQNLHRPECAPRPVRPVCQDPSVCELRLSNSESSNPLGPLKVEIFGCGQPKAIFKSQMDERDIH